MYTITSKDDFIAIYNEFDDKIEVRNIYSANEILFTIERPHNNNLFKKIQIDPG